MLKAQLQLVFLFHFRLGLIMWPTLFGAMKMPMLIRLMCTWLVVCALVVSIVIEVEAQAGLDRSIRPQDLFRFLRLYLLRLLFICRNVIIM